MPSQITEGMGHSDPESALLGYVTSFFPMEITSATLPVAPKNTSIQWGFLRFLVVERKHPYTGIRVSYFLVLERDAQKISVANYG